MLFSRGNVEVWQGRWVGTGEIADAAVEVGRDAARRVMLEHRLAANEQIAAEVRTTTPVAAVLETSVVLPDSHGLAILVVDRIALSAASAGPDGRLVFQDIGNADDVSVIAALANGGVIPTEFEITVKP
jgi:hypothetical protein